LLKVIFDIKSFVKGTVESDPHGITDIATAPPLFTNCSRVSVILIPSKV
jgi:hypothetical protein